MQKLPRAPVQRMAVDRIADDGVADGGEVHSDLVGAAGLQRGQDVGVPFQVLRYPIAGAGRPAATLGDHHPLASQRVAPNGRIDGAALRLQPAFQQRQVLLGGGALLELARQSVLRPRVLCHHHQARGVLVQPMHNARPQRTRLGP